MKSIKGALLVTAIAFVVVVAGLTAGWLTADAAASSPQETAVEKESTTEEPLPDFQPTERLPADSAVAFSTDI